MADPPHDIVGLARYSKIASELQHRLSELWMAPARPRKQHQTIPTTPGLYLFTENGKPCYVGQTRNLRERLRNHTIPGASQEQASFAFLLAKKNARRVGLAISGTRKVVARHPDFTELFLRAKQRVANMEVRFIEVTEPDLRTVLEVYVSLALGTGEFNSFETH